MDVSGAGSAGLATAIQVAVQKQMLDALKQQGAGITQMISSASTPTAAGSTNSPSQGNFVDALA